MDVPWEMASRAARDGRSDTDACWDMDACSAKDVRSDMDLYGPLHDPHRIGVQLEALFAEALAGLQIVGLLVDR
ncbi:hypothetical protein GCM10009672_21650 [Nesterenkonia lutea]